MFGDAQYEEFYNSAAVLRDRARNARGKKQMDEVLKDAAALFNGFTKPEVEAMPFNVRWWVQYYRRDGLNFYQLGLEENYKGPKCWQPGAPAQKLDNLFGFADDLSRLVRELKKILAE